MVTTVVRIETSFTRRRWSTPNFCGSVCWHVRRLWGARGVAIESVRAGRSHGHRAVRDRPRSFRALPHTKRFAPGRRGASAFCRGGISCVLAVRMPGRRLRPISVRDLRPRSTGRLLVQGARILSTLRRPPDGRAVRTPGRSGLPRRAGRQWVLSFPHRLRYVLAWGSRAQPDGPDYRLP